MKIVWPLLACALLATRAPLALPDPTQDSAGPDSMALELPSASVKARRVEDGAVKVESALIRRLPGTLNDPIRAVGYAPGVTVQNDVNVRPLVRGGDAEETRVVLNGLPLLEPYHVGGVFSLFNLGTLESAELHRDDFPVEVPGALSGVLRLKTPSRIPAKAGLKSHVSMLRGEAYAEVPLVPDVFSVFGAGQSFLFNRSLHGILDGASSLSGDGEFQEEMAGYRERINMPDFEDYHWGAALARGNVRADYLGGLSSDGYAVVIARQTNVLSKINPHFGDPTAPVAQGIATPVRKPDPRGKRLSVDSISSVEVGHGSHFLRLAWDVDPEHFLEQDFGYQAKDWNVGFKPDPSGASDLALSQSTRFFNYRLSHTWTPGESHRFGLGAAFDYKRQTYNMNAPWVLYDVIVNGNMDMLEPLGYFAGDGFTMVKGDSARTNFEYLGELPARIRFAHEGTLEERFGSLFLSHRWKTGTGALSYGVRAEYHDLSREFFPAPRADYRWFLAPKHELMITAGLYAQNELPFQERDRDLSLKSEKSAQAGLQWTWNPSPGYKLTAGPYYKRYYDLVAPTLVADGTLDLQGLLLARPDSPLSGEEIAALRSVLDTVQDFSALPETTRRLALETFGGLRFDYANTGTGNSLGGEVTLFYDPTDAWRGWLSADCNYSNRRDREGEPDHPFRYLRPFVVNWVNYFDVPGGFDLGLTYRWALGRPYTPYSGGMDGAGDTDPIRVGARNSGRLSPYSRLDLRLARNARLWGRSVQGYVEIWNAMNSPNYFSRDEVTGELKSAQLNWPFPLFFVGMAADI